jgi:WD40 repeat protein
MPSPQPIRAAILTALMSGILMPIAVFAGSSPQKVWEVRLSEKLTEPGGWNALKGHPIIDLAFSPDGKKIAVTMDDHYQAMIWKTHLLIVDVKTPQAPVRQFDLETCGNDIAWSPNGGALLVCGRIVRLDDGSSCDLSPVRSLAFRGVLVSHSFWLSADRVILFNRTIVDLSCRAVDKWEIAGDWYVADTIPEKGWMLLRESVTRTGANGRTFPVADYAIADRDSRRLTSGLLVQVFAGSGRPVMAPGATAVCLLLVRAGRSVLDCWNLPGGEVIPIAPDLTDYRVKQASRSSPRIIAERWGSHWWLLFDEIGYMANQIVLELPSGRQIASLKPHPQHGRSAGFLEDRYFKCALSPAGDFLAEGGDGSLRIYRLP